MLPALIGYIDVGTGSYLLTAIAGGFATLWFFLRAKIDSLFGRKPTENLDSQEALSASDTAEAAAELKQE